MSDYNERACQNCGSYLHHEDNCPEPTSPSNDYWKKRCEAALSVLNDLVLLKDYKDGKGKTETYLIEQPKAWERARQQLKSNPPKEG